MSRDTNVSVFVISVAADLAQMHPQTLRNYEREGLVEPARTAGGNRLYSEDDLAQLAKIAALTDAGLKVTGIKMVFDLEHKISRLQRENTRLKNQLSQERQACLEKHDQCS